jgi:Domain of unknown function (DUF4157)
VSGPRPGAGPPTRRPVRVDDLGDLLPAARSLWGYVWAGPNSVVGLLGALTTRTRPVRWRGVLLFEDADSGLARFLRWRGFAAITLGHVIVTNRRASDGLLAHELEHVAQAERWGPLYYPAYLLGSLRGYRRNPFERAARRAADVIQTALEDRTRGGSEPAPRERS